MSKPRIGVIGILTDFGTRDWYVASVKAVIISRAPFTQIVDITHEIPARDITAGAFTLSAAVQWFPSGAVFLAIVDPGVGTDRRIIAAHADGRYFVGPDNGVLELSFRGARDLSIVRLTNKHYWLKDASKTFHGRDIMAPVAALLSVGIPLSRLGTPVKRVRPTSLPNITSKGRISHGQIAHIDAFGNLITNLPNRLLGTGRKISIQYKCHRVRMVSSYALGRTGELIGMAGSVGFVELSIKNDSAAKALKASRGDSVRFVFGE